MTTNDTTPELVEVDAHADLDPFGLGLDLDADVLGLVSGMLPMLAPMLAGAGMFPPSDPDAATLDDVSDGLDDVLDRVQLVLDRFDWLATVLAAIADKLPARFAPELPPYPMRD